MSGGVTATTTNERKKGAERRKAHAVHCPPLHSFPLWGLGGGQRAPQTSVRSLRNSSAPGALAFRRYAAALASKFPRWLSSRPCFLRLVRAGVTRPSQVPVLVKAPHAPAVVPERLMPKAAREWIANPCAGAASRSTLQIASGMRPSMSGILSIVTEMGTNVKENVTQDLRPFRLDTKAPHVRARWFGVQPRLAKAGRLWR